MMKKPGLATVILFGLCAALWSAKAIYEVAVQIPYPVIPSLDVLCALAWIAAFILQIIRYRKRKKEE